jgi:hypothetical protein
VGSPAVGYSDLPPGSSVVHDPNAYTDLPPGSTVVTPQQAAPPKADAIDRWALKHLSNFAEHFNRTLTGYGDFNEVIQGVKDAANQFSVSDFLENPSEIAAPMLHTIAQGMQDTWNKAQQEFKSGNFTTAAGLMQRAHATLDAVSSGVPIIGPIVAQAHQEMRQGDWSGGLGTLAAVASPAAISEIKGAFPAGTYIGPDAAPAAAGIVDRAQALAQQHPEATTRVLKYTGKTVGAAAGAKLGGSVGAVVGAEAGTIAGEKLAQKILGKGETPTPPPEGTPAPSPEAPSAPPSPTPTPTASGNDIARGLGYKDAAQAEERLGPEVWRQVQERVQASPEKTAPPTPQPTPVYGPQMPVTTPTGVPQPGPGFNDALDDSAILQKFRQDLSQEATSLEKAYPSMVGGTRGMVVGAAKGQEVWHQLPNWTEADTQQAILGDYSPKPEALDGSDNAYIKIQQYEAAKKAWKQKMGEE